jgi:polyketide synthase PksJ
LGSLKGNIGHLEPASGIASLIKVALAMKHRRFPPTVTVSRRNEFIDLDDPSHPLFLADRPLSFADLGDATVSVHAAINSFSDSGCNVHIVVGADEGDGPSPAEDRTGVGLFVLSARDRSSLLAIIEACLRDVEADAGVTLGSLARGSQLGRAQLPVRLAVIASSVPHLRQALIRVLGATDEQRDALQQHGIFLSPPTPAGGWSAGDLVGASTAAHLLKEARRTGDWREAARLWTLGANLPWQHAWPSASPRRRALPGHPFARSVLRLDLCTVTDARVPSDGRAVADVVVATPPAVTGRSPVECYLQAAVAEMIGLQSADVDLDRSYMDLGIKSMAVAGLLRAVNDRFGLRLTPSVVVGFATLRQFAQYIAAAHPDTLAVLAQATTGAAVRGGSPVPARVVVTPEVHANRQTDSVEKLVF